MSAITQLISKSKFAQLEDILTGRQGNRFEKVTRDDVKNSEFCEERVMVGQILHIKKPSKTKKKITVKRPAGESKVVITEKNYLRLLFFRGDDDEVSVIIFTNEKTDKIAMTFWNFWKMGGMMLISNPRYNGSWRNLDLFQTDCVFPVRMRNPWSEVEIPMAGILEEERYYSFSYHINDLRVVAVSFDEACNNSCCDGRYGGRCWCLKLAQQSMVPTLEIKSNSFYGLHIEPYKSNELSKLLVPADILSAKNATDIDFLVLSRYIKQEMTNHQGGYKITMWSKPIVREGDDIVSLSRGHIAHLEVLGNPLKMYNRPDEQQRHEDRPWGPHPVSEFVGDVMTPNQLD